MVTAEHNPYYPMVPDDLYEKYDQMAKMGSNINVTGAAFEEMVGARDENGIVIRPDIIKRARELEGNYLIALEEAKKELEGLLETLFNPIESEV